MLGRCGCRHTSFVNHSSGLVIAGSPHSGQDPRQPQSVPCPTAGREYDLERFPTRADVDGHAYNRVAGLDAPAHRRLIDALCPAGDEPDVTAVGPIRSTPIQKRVIPARRAPRIPTDTPLVRRYQSVGLPPLGTAPSPGRGRVAHRPRRRGRHSSTFKGTPDITAALRANGTDQGIGT